MHTEPSLLLHARKLFRGDFDLTTIAMSLGKRSRRIIKEWKKK